MSSRYRLTITLLWPRTGFCLTFITLYLSSGDPKSEGTKAIYFNWNIEFTVLCSVITKCPIHDPSSTLTVPQLRLQFVSGQACGSTSEPSFVSKLKPNLQLQRFQRQVKINKRKQIDANLDLIDQDLKAGGVDRYKIQWSRTFVMQTLSCDMRGICVFSTIQEVILKYHSSGEARSIHNLLDFDKTSPQRLIMLGFTIWNFALESTPYAF